MKPKNTKGKRYEKQIILNTHSLAFADKHPYVLRRRNGKLLRRLR
jgi:hypothetical protein